MATDVVRVSTGSWDIKYGLNQSGVNLNEFRITPGYTGSIGDGVNGLYLRIAVSNAGDEAMTINGRGDEMWLDINHCENVHVTGLKRGANALQLKGDVDFVHISGAEVRGTITMADAMVLDEVFCGAAGAIVNIGKVTNLDTVRVGAGTVTIDKAAVAVRVKVWGTGHCIHTGAHSSYTVLLWESSGGVSEYLGQGTLTTLEVDDGLFTLVNSTADAVTITTVNQEGGVITDSGGAVNVSYGVFNRSGGIGAVGASVAQYL